MTEKSMTDGAAQGAPERAAAELRALYQTEFNKLGQMQKDRVDPVSCNWQGGRVNGLGDARMILQRLAAQPPAEACATCGFERGQHTDRNGCGEFSIAQPPASKAGCGCSVMCQDLGKEAGCRYMQPARQELRKLVNVVWNEATESTAVPSTNWADKLIDRVFGLDAAQPQAAPAREDIARAMAYDLEEGAAHGARVVTTPHLDNYHINGHVNLLALADAVLRLGQPPAAPVETPPDWKQDQAETSRLPKSSVERRDRIQRALDEGAPVETANGQYDFPYNRTFQAIAAATSVYAGGVGVSVSVKAFQEAFNSFPDGKPLCRSSAGSEGQSKK